MLGREPSVTFAARPGDVSVQRDAHLQDHLPHQNSFLGALARFTRMQTLPGPELIAGMAIDLDGP